MGLGQKFFQGFREEAKAGEPKRRMWKAVEAWRTFGRWTRLGKLFLWNSILLSGDHGIIIGEREREDAIRRKVKF